MRVLRVSHSAVVDAWRERERQIRRHGVSVRTLSARRWDAGGSVVDLEVRPDEDVQGVRTWGRHPALFVYAPLRLWRALGESWDVIDIHEEPFSLAAAEVLIMRRLRRNRAPYLLYSAQNIHKHYPIPFRWLERWALRGAAAAVVCNEAAGRILERKGLAGRADYVPLGVDLEHYAPTEGLPNNTAEDVIRVGYVGRLEEHKGVRVLLDAVASAKHLHLTVVGAGVLEGLCRARATEPALLGRVDVVGEVSQASLPEVMRGFHVLAVPSLTTPRWAEQFCRVAIEAMACGVPVVASDSGALRDVVGGAGLLVPEGQHLALAAALSRVGSEPGLASQMRASGLEQAARCSWVSVSDRYLEIYRRVTRTHPEQADPPEPEIIVVAFGAPDLLRSTLQPVAQMDVTVVDNSSQPAIRELCRDLGVRYLDPGRNGGFAAGVNFGLRRRSVPGADVLLLNPDAVISADAVLELQRHLRSSQELASVAPAQVDNLGRPARVSWPFPTPWRSWLEAVGLGRLGRQDGFVVGSVLLLRAEALAEVGGFDESFFLYAEETDWARRAACLGWQHREVPSVKATHVGAGTSPSPSLRGRHFYASQERYMRKHYGPLGWQLARVGQVLGAAVRSVLPANPGRQARQRLRLLWRGPLAVERSTQGSGLLTA